MRISVDPTLATPVFEQIVEGVVADIQRGRLVAGERLPTVRALAGELGVATNTVAKAYRVMEEQGHVETRGRGGTLVGPGSTLGLPVQQAAQAYVDVAREHDLSLEQAVGLLRRTW